MTGLVIVLIGLMLAPGMARAASALPGSSALREALAATVATAVVPASDTVSVPVHPSGPDTARVRLGSGAAATSAYVAWPVGMDDAPAIIVVHEWWGLNGQIRSVAHRLAGEGFVAIVPDLYHGKVASTPERAHELSRALDQSRALADLRLAARWLRGQRRVQHDAVGVVGFCMGGSLSQQLAMDTTRVSAAVMFYGAPVTDTTQLVRLRAPLQAHFGAADEGIAMTRVGQLKTALQRLGKQGEVYVYAGAGHAFMHDGRDSYHAEASRQAWARTIAFFHKHLGSGESRPTTGMER